MNDERLHNILLIVLDMLLMLFIFFLGVNGMLWTMGQVEDIRKDCCAICVSQKQGTPTNISYNLSLITR
jgi:hypothetical protein